jgi:hypothetical protein
MIYTPVLTKEMTFILQSFSWEINSLSFDMDLAVSSPYTKEIAIGPYLQPYKTSSIFVIQFHILIPSTLGHLSGLFPFGVPATIMPPYFTSPMRAVCHTISSPVI